MANRFLARLNKVLLNRMQQNKNLKAACAAFFIVLFKDEPQSLMSSFFCRRC